MTEKTLVKAPNMITRKTWVTSCWIQVNGSIKQTWLLDLVYWVFCRCSINIQCKSWNHSDLVGNYDDIQELLLFIVIMQQQKESKMKHPSIFIYSGQGTQSSVKNQAELKKYITGEKNLLKCKYKFKFSTLNVQAPNLNIKIGE